MCGITGWVDFERDLSAQQAVIAAMTATMACRGPDAGRTWCSPRAAIGHRRLAVIDLEGGTQPMRAQRAADVVLSFSGEIYNYRELRTELEGYGHEFGTRSDTEVLLRAWLQWGDGCLPRLNGMFAFAVWDGAREELVLARDRLGVKPLYYAPRIEKGLLRAAAADLLPDNLLRRPKSIYPATADPAYAGAVRAQLTELLRRPDAPLFELVDPGLLAAAFAADPQLRGRMAVQPSAMAPAAFLLDVNEWLSAYRVRVV